MKKLSPKRALEFKRRYLKRMFGMDRKQRVERFAWLVREAPGHPEPVAIEIRKLTAKYERELARFGGATNAPQRDAVRARFRRDSAWVV